MPDRRGGLAGRSVPVGPGEPAVAGPLGAAVVRTAEWQAEAGTHVVYADLDLVDVASLRRELGQPADAGQERVVLAAYERWGEGAPARLNGQFSFAVWDGARRALVLARDHFGLTPLVYSAASDRIVVGGDVRVVLSCDGVSGEIDEDVFVTAHLEGHPRHWNVLGRTCFVDVDMVPPAHVVELGAGTTWVSRYWDPRDALPVDGRNPARLASTLRELLEAAVGDATPDAEEVATHLSGGLDSSGVAALAAQRRAAVGAPAPLAVSWSPPPGGAPAAEHDRVTAVAERWELELVYAPPTVDDLVDRYYRDRTRDPAGDVTSEAAALRVAAARGARVVLSGWGGDELASFSGRGTVVRHLVRTGRLAPLLRTLVRERRGWRELAVGLFRSPTHGFPERSTRSLDERRRRALAGNRPWLRREVLERATLPASGPPLREPRELMAALLEYGHLGVRGVDWGVAGASVGVRYRYPLLDMRVVEFALGLPPEVWLLREGRRRWLMASALEGLVPEVVRYGAKAEAARVDYLRATGMEARRLAAGPVAELVPKARQAHLYEVPAVQRFLRRVASGELPGGGMASVTWMGVPRDAGRSPA